MFKTCTTNGSNYFQRGTSRKQMTLQFICLYWDLAPTHFDPKDTLTPGTLWPQGHFDPRYTLTPGHFDPEDTLTPRTLWPQGHFDPEDTSTPGHFDPETLWPQGHFDPRHFDPTHFDPDVKYHIFDFSIRVKLLVGSELPKSLFKALICTFLIYRDIY